MPGAVFYDIVDRAREMAVKKILPGLPLGRDGLKHNGLLHPHMPVFVPGRALKEIMIFPADEIIAPVKPKPLILYQQAPEQHIAGRHPPGRLSGPARLPLTVVSAVAGAVIERDNRTRYDLGLIALDGREVF